jgi:long-subunit fatty acid transport protein
MDSGRTQRPQRYTDREELENCHTLYAGLNYYICGDKLKLMAGYEYMTADQYDSTDDITSDTWMLAVRTYF